MRSGARWGLGTAGVVLAAVAWVVVTLPPRPAPIVPQTARFRTPVATGAFHVHTTRSDGGGTPLEVAQAAQRAGLDFIILTDHGDGTRAPDPPRYSAGVLVVDGVEISTAGGHYIALDLPATPYPLGGQPDTVVDDVRRYGGFGIIAHPTSSRPGLAWRDWDLRADGIEWLNGDTQWREEGFPGLAAVVAPYFLRPSEALATLLDRPVDALQRWDAATRQDAVVGLAGADAHSGIGYERLFGTFSVRAQLDRPLSGDGPEDARGLMSAMRAGRLFSVVDALGGPAEFEFAGRQDGRRIRMGERVAATRPVELRARVAAPDGSTMILLADGKPVARTSGTPLDYRVLVGRPAAYRVEVLTPGAPGHPPVPWLVSNPIYVGEMPRPAPRSASRVASRWTDLASDDPAGERDLSGAWTVERDQDTTASLTEGQPGTMQFEYRIAGSPAPSPYAAIARSVPAGTAIDHDGIAFDVTADRPVRISLQVRAGQQPGEPRWRKSFFADTERRRVAIAFDELDPVVPGLAARPDLRHIDAVLIVVDLVNAARGGEARLTIERPRFERW